MDLSTEDKLESSRGHDHHSENDIELTPTSSRPSHLNTPLTPYHDTEDGEVDSKPLLSSDDQNLEATGDRSRRLNRLRILSLPVLLSIVSAVIIAVLVVIFALRQHSGLKHGPYWHGFSSIDHWFVFGDSWTDTNFKPWLEQPSTANPIGNPEFPGGTSSHARNYVGYLATSYNESFIGAYTIALSGATVDSTVVPAFIDWLDLFHQVRDRFLPFYTTNSTSAGGALEPIDWKPESTLFSFFFGINDVAASDPTNPPWDAEFVSYEALLRQLYGAGARNFVILNVPPVDQSPAMTEHNSAEHVATITASLLDYNARLKTMANNLRQDLHDLTLFEFDTHALFTKFMADPSSVPQTRSYKNVTGHCDLYEKLEDGARPTHEQIEECGGLGIEEYLWFNSFHVSWPAHDAIAAGLKKLLTGKKWGLL